VCRDNRRIWHFTSCTARRTRPRFMKTNSWQSCQLLFGKGHLANMKHNARRKHAMHDSLEALKQTHIRTVIIEDE